jgi:hypothetical protein
MQRTTEIISAWSEAADHLMLEVDRRRAGYGEPRLRGEFGPGTIRIIRRCSPEGCTTRFVARHAPDAPSLLAVSADRRSRRRRIEFGDPDFDGVVRVSGRDAEAIRAFLTPDRRRPLGRLLFRFPAAEVRHDRIRLDAHDIATDVPRILERARAILAVMEAFA